MAKGHLTGSSAVWTYGSITINEHTLFQSRRSVTVILNLIQDPVYGATLQN